MMFNHSDNPNLQNEENLRLVEERYLAEVLAYIDSEIERIEGDILRSEASDRELKSGAWESHLELKSGANSADSAVVQQELYASFRFKNWIKERLEELKRQKESPYFGKIVFRFEEGATLSEAEPFYIGIKGLSNTPGQSEYIIDWRTPLASLYYESEKGETSYQSPSGTIRGLLEERMQILISRGKIRLLIPSDGELCDELLHLLLSRSAGPRLREIAATIQSEQNHLIRLKAEQNLLVMGVAGSGKSSIALHRIAYLLYRHPELRSEDFLLLTPNEQFSDYVSDLLPALAERNTASCDFTEFEAEIAALGDHELQGYYYAEASSERLNAASSFELASFLDDFAQRFAKENFRADSILGDQFSFSEQDLSWAYHTAVRNVSHFAAVPLMLEQLAERGKLTEGDASYEYLRDEIEELYAERSIRAIYRILQKDSNFSAKFPVLGRKHGNFYDRVDLTVMAYLAVLLYGPKEDLLSKQVVVDEMQDLLPLEHQLIRKALDGAYFNLYGDLAQGIRFPMPDDYLAFVQSCYAIRDEHLYSLKRSYRSTWEISEFAGKIASHTGIQAVERHGDPVLFVKYGNQSIFMENLPLLLQKLRQSDEESMALIISNSEKRKELYEMLKAKGVKVSQKLLRGDEKDSRIVMVLDPETAKGMEFDVVILTDADKEAYPDEVGRKRLYVACTRALHRLIICHSEEPSPFLPSPK